MTNKRMQFHMSLTHDIQGLKEKESITIGIACDICGKERSNGNSLKRHHLTKHTSDEEKNLARIHICISCPKRFYTKNKLATHAYVHSDTYNFSCDNCIVYFKTV